MPGVGYQLCAFVPQGRQVNTVDLIAYYGIPGLFGPGMFEFRRIDPKIVQTTTRVEPVTPSCCVRLSPEAMAKSDEYYKPKGKNHE
jgi:hypothetical protein